MTSKALLDAFYAQKTLAVAGVSRNPQKFGTMVYRELKAKGYTVYAVNPSAQTIEGDPCYPNLGALPGPVGGLIISTPPAQSEQLVKDAAQAGVKYVWLQRGSESPAAIKFCQDNGIQVVFGECVFMYAEPVGFLHKIHRFVNTVSGKKPV
jgi:predicted CoA-binding protein